MVQISEEDYELLKLIKQAHCFGCAGNTVIMVKPTWENGKITAIDMDCDVCAESSESAPTMD